MRFEIALIFSQILMMTTAVPLDTGCDGSVDGCPRKFDNEAAATSNNNSTEPLMKQLESWLEDVYPQHDRTWRLNRKSLVPILIGLAVKSLGVLTVVLTGLTIVGSVALANSKISLAISAFMLLKRFFSSDASSGGFFGLNPLSYPHGGYSNGEPSSSYSQGNNRKSWHPYMQHSYYQR